jgi:hypothetical protein
MAGQLRAEMQTLRNAPSSVKKFEPESLVNISSDIRGRL